MTECRDAELQDLLPDYAADLLDDAQAAQVAAHVATCRACAEDVQLLRVVQRLRPAAGSVDIARIVAALPSAPGAMPYDATADTPAIVRDITTAPSKRTRSGGSNRRTETPRRSWITAPGLRAAAVLGVMVAGAASLLTSREGLSVFGTPGMPVVAESVMSLSSLPADSEAFAYSSADLLAGEVLVSYGDLGNYTDEELESMLDRLEQWDGVPGSEPAPAVLVNTVTGGAR